MLPRFSVLALAFGLVAGPVVADTGHDGHGAALDGYRGHAATLGEPGNPATKARTVAVVMNDDMRFLPAAVSVRRGETIRFVVRNAGAIRHEMTLGTAMELKAHAAMMERHPDMQHADPNSVTVEPGGSRMMLWHFSKAGVFDFACLEPGHMQAGMTGRITVR